MKAPLQAARLAALGLLLGTLSCSDSGSAPLTGGAPASAPTLVDFVIADEVADELFAFEATVNELRLERADGTLTANLLGAPLDLEFLGLAERAAWLSRREVEAGDYAAVVVRLAPGSYRAASLLGAPVDVVALSDELRAPFLVPLNAVGQPYARLEIDLDLSASLAGDVTQGSVLFAPMGSTEVSDGAFELPLDGNLALVRDRDFATGELTVDVFADQALSALIGRVTTTIAPDALLVDGQSFVQTYLPFYLTSLTPGAAVVDLAGTLGSGGRLSVSCVELEDQNGTTVSSQFPLKVAGRIVEITSPYVLKLQVRDVKRGEQLIGPLEGAPILDVLIDPQLGIFFDGEDLVNPATLVPGIDLDLKSQQLSLSPLVARRVGVLDFAPAQAATVTAVNLPSSFQVRFAATSLPVLSGLVASDTTPVLVLPGSTPFLLTTPTVVEIPDAAVRPGQSIIVNGVFSGSPVSPLVQASALAIRPGTLLDATATAPSSVGFATSGGRITEAFGPGLPDGPAGPLQVAIAEGAVFRGAATTEAAFLDLLSGPEEVRADVYGLEADAPAQIEAYEIVSSVLP